MSNDVQQQTVVANVRGMKGWLKFLGIMSIIAGALQAITVVGLIVAWMPIWLGVLLLQAGSRAQEYADRNEPVALAGFTGKLRTLFLIMGILTIVSIGLSVIGAIIGATFGLFTGGLPALLEQYGIG
mgnify:CR=1 FL=1